jgi:hypothetical protein
MSPSRTMRFAKQYTRRATHAMLTTSRNAPCASDFSTLAVTVHLLPPHLPMTMPPRYEPSYESVLQRPLYTPHSPRMRARWAQHYLFSLIFIIYIIEPMHYQYFYIRFVIIAGPLKHTISSIRFLYTHSTPMQEMITMSRLPSLCPSTAAPRYNAD